MKSPSRLQIARAARKEIDKLQNQRERVYKKALKAVGMPDTTGSFDYFFNQANGGYIQWEEDYLR